MTISKKLLSIVSVLVVISTVCLSVSNFTAIAKNTVKSKSVELNVNSVTLAVGDIITLDAIMNPVNSTDTLKWKSSNKDVVTVTKNGVITANKKGKATITVKTKSNKKATCSVIVKKYLSLNEVEKLIKENAMTEDKVKALIKQYGLTEERVVELIKQNSSGYSSYAPSTQTTEWLDGTEVKLWKGQTLPYKSNDNTVINEISVKKYHCEEWNNTPQKYKYIVSIKGSCTEKHDVLKTISLQFFGNDMGRDYYLQAPLGSYGYNLNVLKNEYDSNGEFEYVAEQYNIYDDIEIFYIEPCKIKVGEPVTIKPQNSETIKSEDVIINEKEFVTIEESVTIFN